VNWVFDDIVGKITGKEKTMSHETQTYAYEVIVPEKKHTEKNEDGTYKTIIDREYKLVAEERSLRVAPTREELLAKHQDAIIEAGITLGTVAEVVTNIVPFCR